MVLLEVMRKHKCMNVSCVLASRALLARLLHRVLCDTGQLHPSAHRVQRACREVRNHHMSLLHLLLSQCVLLCCNSQLVFSSSCTLCGMVEKTHVTAPHTPAVSAAATMPAAVLQPASAAAGFQQQLPRVRHAGRDMQSAWL
jgi:hypothetical protein